MITTTKKRFISFSLLILLTLSLLVTNVLLIPSQTAEESKILFEYVSGGAIAVVDNVNDIPNDAYFNDSKFSMQIMFNYAHYNDDLYKKQRVKGESFISRSKKIPL